MPESPKAVDAMLAEYSSLRQESLSAITNRITVANFAFGAAAVLVAALIAREKIGIAESLVGLALIPQIAKAGLLIWLGEYQRSQRAGKAISVIEAKVNKEVGREDPTHSAMEWENALIKRGVHMTYPYLATIALLIFVSMGSAAYASYLVVRWTLGPDAVAIVAQHPMIVICALAMVFMQAEIGFIVYTARNWKIIREHYRADAPPLDP